MAKYTVTIIRNDGEPATVLYVESEANPVDVGHIAWATMDPVIPAELVSDIDVRIDPPPVEIVNPFPVPELDDTAV